MHLIGRRNFLNGLGLGAGAHLLAPMARTMLPEALGQTPRKRLILWVGHYSVLPGLLPQGSDAGISDMRAFSAFAPFSNEVLVLKNLLTQPTAISFHGSNSPLSVVSRSVPDPNYPDFPIPGGISIDRHIARRIGDGDPFPSLNFGPVNAATWPGTSADGPGTRFPLEKDPVRAYTTVFRGVMASGDVNLQLRRKLSVLDGIRQDVARMNARLAGPEREKLDQFTQSIRGMETRLGALDRVRQGCTVPPPVRATSPTSRFSRDAYDALVSVGVNALACGLTHVLAIQMIPMSYELVLGPWSGTHVEMFHRPDRLDTWTRYFGYQSELMAQIRNQLAAFREGTKRLWDSCVLAYYNEGGTEHHVSNSVAGSPRRRDVFLMLLGNAGGSLRTGRVLSFPGRSVSDAFVSLANGMGSDITTFGDPETCRGPLPGLT